MSFQFSLDTLLRYRRNTEQREWLKLQVIAQQLASLRSRLQSLQQVGQDIRQQNAGQLLQGVRASEIHFNGECAIVFRQRLAEARRCVAVIEEEHIRQMDVFRNERRKREVLEQLREGECERYRKDRERREQNQSDELFVIRRAISRG